MVAIGGDIIRLFEVVGKWDSWTYEYEGRNLWANISCHFYTDEVSLNNGGLFQGRWFPFLMGKIKMVKGQSVLFSFGIWMREERVGVEHGPAFAFYSKALEDLKDATFWEINYSFPLKFVELLFFFFSRRLSYLYSRITFLFKMSHIYSAKFFFVTYLNILNFTSFKS